MYNYVECGFKDVVMPWSHQTESTLSIGELVSHTDFHGGPSPSNLYDNVKNGHNMHSDIHVWEVGQPGKQLYITTSMLTKPRS